MRVLAATSEGLFEIDGDGGQTRLLEGDVDALGWAPDHATWWAVAGGHLVHDGAPVAEAPASATCVLAVDGRVVVGTQGAHLLSLDAGGLTAAEPFDHAAGRDTWHTPWGGPPAVRSLAADADGRVLVNIHVGGISRDDGGRWTPLIDVETDVHQVVAGPDGLLLAATGAAGLAVSRDGGGTWLHVTEGFHGTYLRALALGSSWLVVSASTGPFARDGRLYRAPIGDPAALEPSSSGLPGPVEGNIDTHWLAADGDVVVAALPDGDLYVSDDAAATWRPLAGGLGEPRAVLVSVSASA